jgi:hypothetical protein
MNDPGAAEQGKNHLYFRNTRTVLQSLREKLALRPEKPHFIVDYSGL